MVQNVSEVERVRAMLLEQAAQPLSVLLESCQQARARLEDALAGVSERQARFKPPAEGSTRPDSEDHWSIAQVLRHLIQSEEGMVERVKRLARGEPAESSTPGALGGHADTGFAGLVEALRASRERLRDVVATIDGSERLDAVVAHAAFGELNCRAWLALWARHEAGHARQVEQIKSVEGFPNE